MSQTEVDPAASDPTPGGATTARKRRREMLLARKEAVVGVLLLVIVLGLSLTVGMWSPFTPNEVAGKPFSGPSGGHLLGTDDLGRDYLTRLLIAGRTSLSISFFAASIALVVGSAIGIAAGLRGGWLDSALMGLTDLVLSFPSLLLALSAVTVFSTTKTTLILVLALIAAPQFARVIRSRCLELREREFVLSARVSGLPETKIALRHIVPNVMPLITVQFANTAAIAILIESSLSYLGLGVQLPEPSWGNMIFASQNYMTESPWLPLAPAGALLLTSIAWGLIGEGSNVARRSLI